jgi:phosphomevalonate kinase
MNSPVQIAVPGKIIISGEYAVLNGAIAIVSTIDQKLKVSIKSTDHEHHVYTTSIAKERFPFLHDNDSNIHWLASDPGSHGSLVQHVFKALEIIPEEKLYIAIDSSEFFISNKNNKSIKLGIGSSAAVSVGLIKALSQHLKLPLSPEILLEKSNLAHQMFQNNLGSGIDVLCSFADQGVIECTKDSINDFSWTQLHWPKGLYIKILTTCEDAITHQLIGNYYKTQKDFSEECSPMIQELLSITSKLSTAWKSQSINAILDLLVAYDAQLKKIDHLGSIGIYTTIHKNIQRVAEEFNVFYKPSGAGGGDIGIALSSSPESLNSFLDQIDRLNWNISCLPSKDDYNESFVSSSSEKSSTLIISRATLSYSSNCLTCSLVIMLIFSAAATNSSKV